MQSKTKKRSASSVLAERRRQRAAITPAKHSVRLVKFSPEEMAYDPDPRETGKWTPVGRGPKAIFAKPKGYVVLEPDVQQVFRDSASVNHALRKLIEAVPRNGKQKKSA